jgi:glycosyltransferase involved in cell wall biosynthesis
MKVLWISHNVPYPPKTGVLQRNYNLLREASRHAEIFLVAILKEDILPGHYDLEAARDALGKFCRQIDIIELPVESSRARLYSLAMKSLFTTFPMSVNWVESPKMHDRIRRLSSEHDFDVVHFDTISLAEYRHDVSARATVLNHHNIESHLLRRRMDYERNALKRYYYGIEAKKLEHYEQAVCGQFDTNFTVSSLDGERLLSIAPDANFDVIANGVDIDYFSSVDQEPVPKSVIMVSGMNWFPNRHAVLYMCNEIWPLLTEEVPEITWTVVGASPPQRVKDLATQDKRVTVTGFVDDVRPYMKGAEIYLCPMRDGGGTRVKILDALSMGMPIVATTMACEGISISPEKNVLIANSPEEFVAQIKRIQSDGSLRERLRFEARKFAKTNYAWPVIGAELGRVYNRLLSAITE